MAYAFPFDYAQARKEFLHAADSAGARLRTFPLPGRRGPDGGELRVDTAYLGPAAPATLLVTVSGTHGIEGFCGSACQTRILLGEGMAQSAAARGAGVLLVHALNPYGFAYLRRVNEDNIDLNRNFVDHNRPPHNDPYDLVHSALTPQGDDAFHAADVAGALTRLRDRLGPQTLQEAVTRGQYRHPDGLFYGGRGPCWSQRVFRTIVADQIEGSGAAHIGYIDLHTGLGERGLGEPIFRGGRDADAYRRARRWYGDALTASEKGTSSSTPIVGNTATAVADGLARDRRLTAITLEFGTRPGPEVLLALCADNWLHLHREPADAARSDLKTLIRAAFSPADDEEWRTSVFRRAREVFTQALTGLAADAADRA
ncbi:M14 family metallopeptidase [Streptomyces sp. PR69]|uniref:M14 family metallopeptidase n=1 Tax=Streptomyces sp. PR69 TaxID=2984950 RepID=UPI002264A77F|nr:M14 family metallopeptidase [Streptomyces sp. PR69]